MQAWRLVMVRRITDLLPPPKTSFWRHWKEVVVAVFCAVLFVMAWVLAAIFFAGVTGCCLDYTVKKCCPPPKYIDVPVKVQVPCNLPPPVKLEAVTRVTVGCPEKMTCFDVENAARIADRESKMKSWIKEARAACGAPASQPTSVPATVPTTQPR